jgi:hypothetical protein
MPNRRRTAHRQRCAGPQFDPAVVAAFAVTLRAPALGVEESRPMQRISAR